MVMFHLVRKIIPCTYLRDPVLQIRLLQDQTARRQETLVCMCPQKSRERYTVSEEETAPPIPPHTVEVLYTAVNKLPKQLKE